VTFDVAAEKYDRFMGRYSVPLASPFADFAGIVPGQRVVDVGSGPGALTTELVHRLGAAGVTAADPSEPLLAAARERHPAVSVQRASAEELPFEDGEFDGALAQLVVHLMADPVRGLREMARVTRSGGVVAVCVWDHAGEQGPLHAFWEAARELDPDVADESHLPGTRKGQLEGLLDDAGLREVEAGALTVQVEHESFDDWWEPFTLGVGPAGAHVAKLDATATDSIRARCRDALGDGSFTVTATAWAARGRA
jgi:SAM-dependent methyltransferase